MLWVPDLMTFCGLSAASLSWCSLFILLPFAYYRLNINSLIQKIYSYHIILWTSQNSHLHFIPSTSQGFLLHGLLASSWDCHLPALEWPFTPLKKLCIEKNNFTRLTKTCILLIASYFLKKAFCFFYFYSEVNVFCSLVLWKSICFTMITLSCAS